MIILDTHIWIWWTDENPQLSGSAKTLITKHQSEGLGVHVFSLREVAKLHEKGRLNFTMPLDVWFAEALSRPNIKLIQLEPAFIVESISLPGDFHKDPADQIIVATARVLDCPLATFDARILKYPYVRHLNI